MKKKKKDKRPLQDPKSGNFGLSFGDLLKNSGVDLPKKKKASVVQPKKVEAQPAPSKDDVTTLDFSSCTKVIVRKDTKRRRGKTVTLIKGLELETEELMFLAQELRKTLGCGSTLEEDDVLLQGDQTLRVKDWLQKQGVKNIVLAR